MEARGKYDFSATGDDELSFRKHDILKIISLEEDWCKAEMNGLEGFVPKNYIEMQTPGWFRENASRSAAEEHLRHKDLGDFVIRGCQSSPGDFSISVRHENDVQHFKVMRDSKGQYFLWSEKFTSLNKLVEFYKSNSISKTRQIYLNDDTQVKPVSQRGSLPELLGCAPPAAPSHRRFSDQTHNQTHTQTHTQTQGQTPGPFRIPGLEERASTIGHTGRNSPISSAFPPRRTSETMPPPQRPGGAVLKVRAVYDFTAEEEDELGFSAGELIEVLDHSDASWWTGRLRGRSGLFPANYTMKL